MAQIETNPTNSPEISVSELSAALKRTLEDSFAYVRVRGEISGFRGPHSSGHVYFALKDQNARLDAIIWRTTYSKLKVRPEEGMEVIASGKISTFAGKSSYQIVVDSLEPAGVGALLALLELRRRKLTEEGLFDTERKRSMPFLPRVIGVVTSPTGAVIRDILHRLVDRYPARVLVWPVRVQGEGSAEEILAAIRGFNELAAKGPIPRPDVLIVARGGGALEDLWSFNDEAVVRAAAESEIPLVSAVGHETDWTLIDHAADLRAPTPTAAVELSTPVRAELLVSVAQMEARALSAMTRFAQESRARLKATARGLPSTRTMLSLSSQRLDAAVDVLRSALQTRFGARRLALATLGIGLERRSPYVQIARWTERTQALGGKLDFLRKGRAGLGWLSLEHARTKLRIAENRELERCADRLAVTARRWIARSAERAQAGAKLRRDVARLESALERTIAEATRRRGLALASLAQVFAAVNYKSVLARGYALVFDKQGAALTSAEDAKGAQSFTIRFADGDVAATTGARNPAKRRAKTSAGAEQESLL
jgi:exodeoxyribonuclease VII large subunit